MGGERATERGGGEKKGEDKERMVLGTMVECTLDRLAGT